MPGQPDDDKSSSLGQPTSTVTRRKWLQTASVGFTSAILAVAGVSADETSPISEGRSRSAVVGGNQSQNEESEDETDDNDSSDGSDNLTLGGGEGYENIVDADDADYIVSGQDELAGALIDAGSGEIVFIDPDVSFEMGNTSLDIPEGVTVASNRGEDGSDGALIETTRGNEPGELFTMHAESRITGIRMRGPWPEGPNGSTNSNAVTAVSEGIEIDNCEIGQFSYAGVNLNNGEAHVHHNHIYEINQSGLGYGVTMSTGRPLIEYNYFDYNRHSIASTGSHEGYVCQYNHFGPNATDIVIDIHEPAGRNSEVHNNIVEANEQIGGDYTPLPALQVRGVPDDVYEITENWFFNQQEPLDSPAGSWTNESIIQPTETAWRNVEFSDNYYGESADVDYDDIIPGYDGSWS